MENVKKLKEKIELPLPLLNKRQKRLFLALKANYIGGGIKEIKNGIHADGGENDSDKSASSKNVTKTKDNICEFIAS